MTGSELSLDQPKWLTLDQACRRLGVHPATLRRWADRGEIDVFITPGGHRRFSLSALEQFERTRHRAGRTTVPGQQWAEFAIAVTRQSLPRQPWVAIYSETERENHRQLGRKLLGLVFQYVSRADEDPGLLREARAIGEQEARLSLDRGQSLVDSLRTMSFFRTMLLEVAVLDMLKSTTSQPDSSVHLLRRIEQLLSEVQIGAVEFYVNRGTEAKMLGEHGFAR